MIGSWQEHGSGSRYREQVCRRGAHLVVVGVAVVEEGDVQHLLLHLLQLARQELCQRAVACCLSLELLQLQALRDLQQAQGRAARWCQPVRSGDICRLLCLVGMQ